MGLIDYHQNVFSAIPDTNENFIVVVPGITITKKYIMIEEILTKLMKEYISAGSPSSMQKLLSAL